MSQWIDFFDNTLKKAQGYIDTSAENLKNIPRTNFAGNAALGVAELGMPIVQIMAHPIKTAQNVKYAATHIPETARAVINQQKEYYNPANIKENLYQDPLKPARDLYDILAVAEGVKGITSLVKKPLTPAQKSLDTRMEVLMGKVNIGKPNSPIKIQPPKPNIPSIKNVEYHASPTQGIKNIDPRSSSTDWGAFTTKIPDYALQSYGDIGGSLYKVEVPRSSRVINELQPLQKQSPHIQAFNNRLAELNPDLFLPTESALGEDITGRLSNVISNKVHPNTYGLDISQWESKILGRYLRRNGIEGVINPEFTEAHYFNKLPVVEETPITAEMMNNIDINKIQNAIQQGWRF